MKPAAGLTPKPVATLSPFMSRFARIMLFALVACWLPSTWHCRLEAAGLFDHHAGCATEAGAHAHADHPDESCQDNTCPTVEEALYKEAGGNTLLSAPIAHTCSLLLTAWFAAHAPVTASALSPERFPPPEKLATTWQFTTRAAPPARAPGLNS